jgi:peptide/nickel transport system permease protein
MSILFSYKPLAAAPSGPPAHARWWAGVRPPPLIVACLGVVGLLIVCALFADLIAPHDPIAQDLRARLRPPVFMTGGTPEYLLGTDALGRDLLSRLIHGARVSLLIGFAGMLLGLTTGALAGVAAGFRRGWLDEGLMFLADVLIALPFLVIALTAVAVFGSSLGVLIGLAGLSGWASFTRLGRGQVLSVREQPYVLAARALGASPTHLAVRHVLPNILAPLIVLATFELTAIILLEASLSFLGVGVNPPTPAWGSMLGDGRNYLHVAWWIGVLPGIAIMLLTISISLTGDWLRDVLDPTLRGR